MLTSDSFQYGRGLNLDEELGNRQGRYTDPGWWVQVFLRHGFVWTAPWWFASVHTEIHSCD
jgi:hypothetical protein